MKTLLVKTLSLSYVSTFAFVIRADHSAGFNTMGLATLGTASNVRCLCFEYVINRQTTTTVHSGFIVGAVAKLLFHMPIDKLCHETSQLFYSSSHHRFSKLGHLYHIAS